MKNYTDEELINKFVDDELSEEEYALFKERMLNDKLFALKAKHYINTDKILSNIVWQINEKEREIFFKEYEAALEAYVREEEEPIFETAVALNEKTFIEALKRIPPKVRAWFVEYYKLRALHWSNITDDVKKTISLFISVNEIKDLEKSVLYIPFSSKVEIKQIDVKPENEAVIKMNSDNNIQFNILFPENIKIVKGNYKIIIYNNEMNILNKFEFKVDENDEQNILRNNRCISNINVYIPELKPSLYMWDLQIDDKDFIKNFKFFIIL